MLVRWIRSLIMVVEGASVSSIFNHSLIAKHHTVPNMWLCFRTDAEFVLHKWLGVMHYLV